MLNLLSLPYEILIGNVLSRMPLSDLLKLCGSNVSFNNICQDDYLWQLRVHNFYERFTKPDHLSWKEYYILIHNINYISIYPGPINMHIEKKHYRLIDLIKTGGSGTFDNIISGSETFPIKINVLGGKISFQLSKPINMTVVNNILQNPSQHSMLYFGFILMEFTDTWIARDILMQQRPSSQIVIIMTCDSNYYNGELYMYYDGSTWKRLPLYKNSRQELFILMDKDFYKYNNDIKSFLVTIGINIIKIDNVFFPPDELIPINSVAHCEQFKVSLK